MVDTVQDGFLIKGPLKGAIVFGDYNGDGIQNINEPSAITASDGSYSFDLNSTTPDSFTVVARMTKDTVDSGSGESFADTRITLVAPSGASVVTPLTNLLVAAQKANNSYTEADLLEDFNLPEGVDVISFQPFSDDVDVNAAHEAETVFQQITTAQLVIARAMEGVSNLAGAGSELSSTGASESALNSIVSLVLDSDSTIDLSESTQIKQLQTFVKEELSSSGVDVPDSLADVILNEASDTVASVAKAFESLTPADFGTPASAAVSKLKEDAAKELETLSEATVDFVASELGIDVNSEELDAEQLALIEDVFVDEDSTFDSSESITLSTSTGLNAAFEINQEEVIEYQTPPAITLIGDFNLTIEVGTDYVDAGATALDEVDGDVSADIVITNLVDINQIGTYLVTYNVKDSADNSATEVVRTITVVDTGAPVITLIGVSPQVIERGDTYRELGAVSDGDETIVIDASSINTSELGSYSVIYRATDSAGNVGVATRTVTVEDTTAPVITIIGGDLFSERVDIYVEAGASSDDGETVTVLSGSVDTDRAGIYEIIYTATDSRLRIGRAKRTVTVVDSIAPVIDTTEIVFSIEEDSKVLGSVGSSEEVTWSVDNSGILVSSSGVLSLAVAADYELKSSYTFIITATDPSNNISSTAPLTISVIDRDEVAPIISLIGQPLISLFIGSTYVDAGATAVDNIDGDITASIAVVNPVDVNSVGTYTVTYDVSDAAGNAAVQVSRTVNITSDVTIPVITLLGEAEVSLELGSTYVDAGAAAVDNIDGDITSSIVVTNAVDVNTVGTYLVTYNVSDAAGNAAAEVNRTIEITPDVTKPVITLIGDPIVDLVIGSTYIDVGATAVDNIDGNITSSIVVTNAVDVNALGTYTVSYTVSDASGNAAIETMRIVNVIGVIDIDGNGQYDALTDGLLLLRSMFGLDGDPLIVGTVASDATLKSAAEIENRIDNLGLLVDVDGNGKIDALTDGLLILRYLFGLDGDPLIKDVVAPDAVRDTAAEIEAHLESLMPILQVDLL